MDHLHTRNLFLHKSWTIARSGVQLAKLISQTVGRVHFQKREEMVFEYTNKINY